MPMRPIRSSSTQAVLLGLLLAAGASHAQYKVVGPDGRITYTDRPVAAVPGSQVQALRRDAGPASSAPLLPIELRESVARFPVTLFTSSDCPPCDSGRKLLQQRGVPYAERLVSSDDDIAALQRLSGGRTVPALTVGSQALRGYQESDWQGTLDLAGYPKASKLPRGWAPPPPAPLVARAPEPAAPVAPRAPVEAPAQAPAAAGSSGIRF
ncbi:MAG: glutaredoxin family protein [Aquabacterium sp.]|nr:glutaredoxin family protein [Aquabacterium sp.]